MTNYSLSIPRIVEPTQVRISLWLVLAVAELFIVAQFVDVKALLDLYIPGNGVSAYVLFVGVRCIVLSIVVFAVLSWPSRRSVADAWRAAAHSQSHLGSALLNTILLAAFAVTCVLFAGNSGTVESLAWPLQIVMAMLWAGIMVTLVGILVPFEKFVALLQLWRVRCLWSVALGSLIVVLAIFSKGLLWSGDLLAGVTLQLSAAIMQLYEPVVEVDVAGRMITVGNFTALITPTCSGMEGIALVTVFVSAYLWIFRSELTFPRAFLLYPVGIAASFLLNAVRIAALTSIGGHISPELAVDGFHSRAGWVAFLIVALSLMAISLGMTGRRREAVATPARFTESLVYLTPFVALMIGTLVVSAAVPLHHPVYLFKVAIVAAALWSIRQAYMIWRPQLSAEAVGGGALVGVIWIATQPQTAGGEALGIWLTELGPALAALWLVARGIGTIVLVPIAEELAFRGYIYRRLISRDFYEVKLTEFSWLALIASSALFGLLHNRWELGVLAGIVFALIMLRHGRLGDAITAHAVANALIFAWALAFQQWSLL